MTNILKGRCASFVLVAVLFLAAAPAAAQTREGGDASATQDQQPQGQDTAAPPTPSPEPVEADQAPRSPVSVSTLGSADGAPVGLLDESNGGFNRDMWLGSSRPWLETALERIPIVTDDPVIHWLAQRLLLTTSASPVGPAHRALITIRIEKLLEAGLMQEAAGLAAAAELPNDEDFAKVRDEALLYDNRAGDICTDKTAARLSSADPFWLELRAYCYAVNGDQPALELTRAIMDARRARDPAFDALLDAILTKSSKPIASIAKPTAVHIFLLRQLGWPVTAQIGTQLGTAAVLLAVRDPRNSPADRLQAAEGILSTGAVSDAELRDIADAQAFTSAQLSRASEDAGALSFLTRQALLRQAAGIESRAAAKVALIERADPTLNEPGPFAAFAALEARNAKAVPSEAIADRRDAWVLARCLILRGDPNAAAPLLQNPDNPLIAEAGLALDMLRPTPEHDLLAQADISWLAAHATLADGWPAATYLALELANVLGLPLAPDALNVAATLDAQSFDGARVDRDLFADIDAAAAAPDRRGETILRIIDAIGPSGPSRLAPDAAVHLIGVLRQLGFSEEARALAAEDLLLGPPRPAHAPAPSDTQAEP